MDGTFSNSLRRARGIFSNYGASEGAGERAAHAFAPSLDSTQTVARSLATSYAWWCRHGCTCFPEAITSAGGHTQGIAFANATICLGGFFCIFIPCRAYHSFSSPNHTHELCGGSFQASATICLGGFFCIFIPCRAYHSFSSPNHTHELCGGSFQASSSYCVWHTCSARCQNTKCHEP